MNLGNIWSPARRQWHFPLGFAPPAGQEVSEMKPETI
jgi:hypothetical protein